MRKFLFLPALLVCLTPVFGQGSVQQLLTEGQRAYMAGDTATAKARFTTVLQMDPQNTTATNYLRMIRAAEAKNPASKLGADLEKLVIPAVELKDATFGSALDYLKQQAAKQSVAVSFVPQVPKETLDAPSVTVSLRQIPFLEALRYICDMGGAKYELERYAVVIKPK